MTLSDKTNRSETTQQSRNKKGQKRSKENCDRIACSQWTVNRIDRPELYRSSFPAKRFAAQRASFVRWGGPRIVVLGPLWGCLGCMTVCQTLVTRMPAHWAAAGPPAPAPAPWSRGPICMREFRTLVPSSSARWRAVPSGSIQGQCAK